MVKLWTRLPELSPMHFLMAYCMVETEKVACLSLLPVTVAPAMIIGNIITSYISNFDGYTNSILTITIGAIDRNNNHPRYSERCSAQLAVTYSSGSGGYIVTTDWPAEVLSSFSDTRLSVQKVMAVPARQHL